MVTRINGLHTVFSGPACFFSSFLVSCTTFNSYGKARTKHFIHYTIQIEIKDTGFRKKKDLKVVMKF